MAMKTRADYAEDSAKQAVEATLTRWEGTGLSAEVCNHSSGFKRPFVRIECPRNHWRAVAKWLRFELGVDHCSMITGIHPPERGGWTEQVIHDANILQDDDVPMEFEVKIGIPDTTRPTVQSVQEVWVGADWNEKETWDLVGIDFEGHENMRRVLQPHDTPPGYHPLQKQHKIRYHDFEEMYDDAQGFGRKPVDSGKIK